MTVTEARQKLMFYVDAIYQKGFDLGWECVMEELEVHADELWNLGAKVEAEAVRETIKKIRANEEMK